MQEVKAALRNPVAFLQGPFSPLILVILLDLGVKLYQARLLSMGVSRYVLFAFLVSVTKDLLPVSLAYIGHIAFQTGETRAPLGLRVMFEH